MKSEIQINNFDIEALRARLRRMPDVELIRFGKDARYMCSPWANMNKPPRAEFQIQLDEAKAEWKRRHPKNTEQAKRPRKAVWWPNRRDQGSRGHSA
jgi:hypothetical protein